MMHSAGLRASKLCVCNRIEQEFGLLRRASV
jgi:hypothetical protein